MRLQIYITLSLLLISSPNAWSFDQLVIGSSADYYTIEKKGDGFYYVGSQKVSLDPLKDFLPLFQSEFGVACPDGLGKPDITMVKKKITESPIDDTKKSTSEKLSFFMAQKIAKKNKSCAPIGGQGIFYLPLHRSWFTGKETLSLPEVQTLKIERDENELFHGRQISQGVWKNLSKKSGYNLDFLNNFVTSLSDFTVSARVHPAIAKGRPQFKMILNNKTYHGYYIGKAFWAVKFPRTSWLVASANWSHWDEMSPQNWQDRFFSTTQLWSDKTLPLKQRIEKLNSIGVKWSGSIKKSLQTLITDPNEPTEIKLTALKMMRRKPTLDNFGAMVKALRRTQDKEFLLKLTKTLRIRNPKGPIITLESSDQEDSLTIATWETWWKSLDKK